MLEGWLRTFTAERSGYPGCKANTVVALADDGSWSVYVDPSAEDGEEGVAFVLDEKRRKRHWQEAQTAISLCQNASESLADAARSRDRQTLAGRLDAFFESYILVQVYYQASSDRFTRMASRRYADDARLVDARVGWSGTGELMSASLKERRAWRGLKTRAAEEVWGRSQVEAEVRVHAVEFGSNLGGATSSGEDVLAFLLRAWDSDDSQPGPTRSQLPQRDADKMYSALRELGQQRLVIRDGFTVAARASSETLREIAFAGFGEQVSPDEKLALWKSVRIGELRDAAAGSAIDAEVAAQRRRCGALKVVGELSELSESEASDLRELVARDRAGIVGKPLRGLVGFRGEAETVEGVAFVLAAGRSAEENVAACEQGLHNGDILVTGMTHPWLVPACTRAAGIVTDQGGVTCHAVVVATELGIPCIVGTGHATDVLRTGDRIVLEMSTGRVERAAA